MRKRKEIFYDLNVAIGMSPNTEARVMALVVELLSDIRDLLEESNDNRSNPPQIN